MTNEKQMSSVILAETIEGFNGLTIQSKINDSSYYNSEEYGVESDPKSDQLVATHIRNGNKRKGTDTNTTNKNSPQMLLISGLIPEITPVVISSAPRIADSVTAITGTLHTRSTILLKDIVTDAVHSAARVFKYITVVNWIDTDGEILRDGKTVRIPPQID